MDVTQKTGEEALDVTDTSAEGGAEQIETWIWDGDFGHVLGCIEGEEADWLVEQGVLHTEDDEAEGVSELLVGDIVYRLRKAQALEVAEDPRADLFSWGTVDPETATVWVPNWGGGADGRQHKRQG